MPKKSRSSGFGTLIVMVIVVIAGIIYSTAGSDPLGLSTTPTAVIQNNTPTEIPQNNPTAITPTQDTTGSIPTLPPMPGASWWQVYFDAPRRLTNTDEQNFGANGIPADMMKGSIAEKLITRIDAAQKTIHIASFETDVLEVAQALIRAKQRGVDVRWITDDENGIAADSEPGHGQFKMMEDAGIPVIDDKRGGLMHNKFWLFDGQTTWTGSTNITISGMFEQDNNVVVIESPELTAIYERQFEDMWSGQFGAKSPSTVDQQSVNIDGTAIQVLFSPEDNAISHIIPYVKAAQKNIRFMAFSFTQPDLGQAMIERFQNGVDVKGVFETTGSETEYSQLTPLYCVKAPVRQDGNPAFLHHKVIIIDEHIVITGSLNLTDNANKSNNENVIIIDNADIARLFMQEFERVWALGSDPDPAKITCK